MNITSKHFELTPPIEEYVKKKINQALEGLHGEATHVDVMVEKTTMHHQKGEHFRVSVHVDIPRGEMYCDETTEDLYSAIDLCADGIGRKVYDAKSKKQARQRAARKSARSLKSALTFWK
jgi:ribosomal subunit interface protein